MDLKSYIRTIEDFPKEGISFKDLTTLWKEGEALKKAIDLLTDEYKDEGVTKVVAAEARGFIMGSPIAYNIGAGFIPIRKKGKLPAAVLEESYELEYGNDQLTMHKDAVVEGDRVLIIDDVIATGGTLEAMIKLVMQIKDAKVAGIGSIAELLFLGGREKINKSFPKIKLTTLISYS